MAKERKIRLLDLEDEGDIFELSKDRALIIDHLPFTISDSNRYYLLERNLTGTDIEPGIAISPGVRNIIIDLDGHVITCRNSTKSQNCGISGTDAEDITIMNGRIEGFYIGVRVEGDGKNLKIENLILNENRFRGLFLSSQNLIVKNCRILNTGGLELHKQNYAMGIEVINCANMTIEKNNIQNTYATGVGAKASGIYINDNCQAVKISDNIISSANPSNTGTSSSGIWIGANTDAILEGNCLNGLDLGIWIKSSSQNNANGTVKADGKADFATQSDAQVELKDNFFDFVDSFVAVGNSHPNYGIRA